MKYGKGFAAVVNLHSLSLLLRSFRPRLALKSESINVLTQSVGYYLENKKRVGFLLLLTNGNLLRGIQALLMLLLLTPG